MRNLPIYLKAIFLFLTITILTSCESESLNEEIGINEQDTFQIDKDELQHPDDRGN